jgi:hypothetical protein
MQSDAMFARLLLTAVLALGCAGASAQTAWQTYTGRHFTISYPAGWKVNPAFVDHGYGFYQGDTEDVRAGVAFTPTADIAPGTNLQSDQLMLAVEVARPGDMCQASAFLVDPPPNNETQMPVNKPDAAQTLSLAGDLYAIEHLVLVVSRTPCIAVQYYIVTARDAQTQFDRKAVVGLLNHIAATVKPVP